jgi:hypothetical protein
MTAAAELLIECKKRGIRVRGEATSESDHPRTK